ncbi:MAG: carboxymuconolactone decarboxylase family protein [Chlorobiales bacterium]|nr:carboxymuconolactone decarboxylase family protein [Chlorobiales bacterium]
MSIRYIKARNPLSGDSLSGKVLSQVRREFGEEVEPFALHKPVPELLAGAWMACRETLLAGGGGRDAKELVAATVSSINRCHYCVDAHSIMLLESSGHDYLEALVDTNLEKIAAWASATLVPDSPILHSPPFTDAEAPAFLGTAVFFHYINRMVTILLGSSPLPFSSGIPKQVSMRLAAWFFGGAIRLRKPQGASLELLPEATLPENLSWAKSSLAIAGAFARFAEAVETAGARSLSEEVRLAVSKSARNWDGSNPPMNDGWYKDEIAHLQEVDKAAGKLAFLTAFAPYMVDEKSVCEYSMHFPGDEMLISALAWSSFTAARRIGSWL